MTVLVICAVMTVGFVGERGPGWMADPVGWSILLVVTLPLVVLLRDRNVAAGADWLRRGRRWVDVYALREVHASVADDGTVALTLTDSDRRWVRMPAAEIENVPAAWALTVNGIRHSVAAGAGLSGDAVYRLGLGGPHADPDAGGGEPRRGPGRWLIGAVLLLFSVMSILVCFALAGSHAWFGDEGFDFALGAGLCVVLQLSVCAVAAGVGNVGMQGVLGAIATLTVPCCLLFGPVGVGLGLFADRGTAVVAGMVVGMALVLAAGWAVGNRARIAFLLGRALRDPGHD